MLLAYRSVNGHMSVTAGIKETVYSFTLIICSAFSQMLVFKKKTYGYLQGC